MAKYYITTPIYYINDVPHIGHAYTTCAADVMARFKRICGFDVFFLTGVDEHGQKAEKAASEQGIHPKELADNMVGKFTDLWKTLNITNTDFIRTTDERHHRAVQYLFKKIEAAGDIYLGEYEDWYCIPCESYFTDLQLVDGKCPDCHRGLERLKEESYFFRLSKFGDPLLQYFEGHKNFVLPEVRFNEVTSFVRGGLRDLSVSRTSFTWGIPIPDNPKHIVYVWFDALINYLSALGFPADERLFEEYWPCDAHLIGKDILRFHAVYWPAFLMAAGIELPKTVFAHGWWTVEGQKMSKSLGNVVAPAEVCEKYGVDQFRFFLFREVPFGLDGDFSKEAIIHRINGDLANDYGNLVSRSVTMINRFLKGRLEKPTGQAGTDEAFKSAIGALVAEYDKDMNAFAFYKALQDVFEITGLINKYVDTEAPWKLAKEDEGRLKTVLFDIWNGVRIATLLLYPFMPEKTGMIWNALGKRDAIGDAKFQEEKNFYHSEELAEIQKVPPIFPRVEA